MLDEDELLSQLCQEYCQAHPSQVTPKQDKTILSRIYSRSSPPISIKYPGIPPTNRKLPLSNLRFDFHEFTRIEAAESIRRILYSLPSNRNYQLRIIIGKGDHSVSNHVLIDVLWHIVKEFNLKCETKRDNPGEFILYVYSDDVVRISKTNWIDHFNDSPVL